MTSSARASTGAGPIRTNSVVTSAPQTSRPDQTISTDLGQHLARGALAALDRAVQVALAVSRRVFTGEVDTTFRIAQAPPEIRVLPGSESRVGPTHPRVQ